MEEVNCLCLISGQWNSTVLCGETTIRLVPLLTTFAKLKRIYVGGLVTENWHGQDQLVRRSYFPGVCSSPENHRDLAKSFCYNLLGAFKTRLLPLDFDVKGGIVRNFVGSLGLCARSDKAGDGANMEGMCTICRDVCSYFPLQEVIVVQPHFCRCAKFIDVFEAASKRKGAREIFRKKSCVHLPNFVDERLKEFTIEEEEELRRRLADFGITSGVNETLYLTTSDINDLDRLIAVGYEPSSVPKERLYRELHLAIGHDGRREDVFAKSTFDALVARGFAFDEADVIILDERMEPALKDLPALIRGENHDDDDDDAELLDWTRLL